MALHFGYKVDMTIFPKHVSVAVTGLDNDDYALYTSASVLAVIIVAVDIIMINIYIMEMPAPMFIGIINKVTCYSYNSYADDNKPE